MLTFLFSWDVQAHDFKLGYFEVKSREKITSLFVRFDREDLLKSISVSCKDYNKLRNCFEAYLNKHFYLVFDGDRPSLRYIEHQFTEDFIELTYEIEIDCRDARRIEVFNNCLLEASTRQQNIVEFNLHGQKRSFRLNKDRIQTTVEYKKD